MNRASAVRMRAASSLHVETGRLGNLLRRYLAGQLNRLFELTASGASSRRLRTLFYVLIFAVAAFGAHVLVQVQFRPETSGPRDLQSLLTVAFITGLRIILILGIAASASLNSAGRFLADIFELKDPRTAWRYIGSVAMGAGQEVVHLREGRIADADKSSPLVLIGGPGRVVVDYDTAALF